MEDFKANYGYNALIMFSLLLCFAVFALLNEGSSHLFMIYPFAYYLLPLFYNSTANYKITNESLLVEKLFSKKIIPTNRIRRVEVLENEKWLQILKGRPKHYVSIKYNRFDEIHEYPENPEKFRDLLLRLKESQLAL